MQARLRAQLGDRSEYSGERRRRSVVVASMVLTITDPLRGSYPFWHYLQAALIRSCGASFACMELTTICRFQRLQASTKSLLHSLFLWFFSAFDNSRSPIIIHHTDYQQFITNTNYRIPTELILVRAVGGIGVVVWRDLGAWMLPWNLIVRSIFERSMANSVYSLARGWRCVCCG